MEDCLDLMRGASERGWRSCVFNRRGHGGEKLATAEYDLAGNVEDTEQMVDLVRGHFPLAYIGRWSRYYSMYFGAKAGPLLLLVQPCAVSRPELAPCPTT